MKGQLSRSTQDMFAVTLHGEMGMKQLTIVILLGSLLVWAGFSIPHGSIAAGSRERLGTAKDDSAALLDEVTKIGSALNGMESRLRNLETRPAASTASATSLEAASAPAKENEQANEHESEVQGSTSELTRAEKAEREQHAFEHYFGILDQTRTSERVDLSWARAVGERAMDVVSKTADVVEGAQNLSESHIASVDCGSTLCRIEATHDSGQAQDEFQIWFLRGMRSNASLWRKDGRTVVYIARQGHTLPVWNEVMQDQEL